VHKQRVQEALKLTVVLGLNEPPDRLELLQVVLFGGGHEREGVVVADGGLDEDEVVQGGETEGGQAGLHRGQLFLEVLLTR